MRNGKKWLAVTAALCMALPSMTAFAGQTQSTGIGGVELDPKEVTPYYHVVLPTINASTYDFILDPGKELIKYDATTYAADKTAYFTNAVAGTLSNPESTTSDGKLYVEKYEEVVTANVAGELKAEYVNASGGIAKKGDNKYYVWIPNTSNLPEGKYEELTATNVLDYCTAKDSASKELAKDTNGTITSGIDSLTLNTVYNSGDYVFDSKLYKMGYEELTGTYDIADYVTIDETTKAVTIETNNKALYYKKQADGTFNKIATGDVATYVKVTEPTTTKTDKSEKLTIVNKSSANTVVTATVTVKKAGTLKFLNASPTAGSADASVYMTIGGQSGNPLAAMTPVPVVADATDTTKIEGKATVTLTGLNDITKYNTYQGDIIPATGGHKYVRYNMTTMAYDTAELEIQIEANADAAAQPAWKAYNKALQDAYTANNNVAQKPEIEVVYKLQNPVDDAANAPTRVNAHDVQWDRSMNPPVVWFTATATNRFTDSTKLSKISVKKNDGSGGYTDTTTATELAKVTFAANGYAGISWDDLTDTFGLDENATSAEIVFVYDDVEYVIAW